MPLAATTRAIGAVTEALRLRLGTRTNVNVLVGRPEQNTGGQRHLNLFLYEILYDPHLKNYPLDEGQKPPLWLVLKYLITPFGNDGESDSTQAHEDLGSALRALYEDDLLRLDGLTSSIVEALENNPEQLHVTFDESSTELLSKLMQGADERLRLSIAFQVRPVMIATVEPPDYSLLVGVDYTQTPTALTEKYVGLDVIPSLGAFIAEIEPKGFELGETVTLRGTDLHLSGLSVRLGTVELPVTMQRPDELQFVVDGDLIDGAGLSAGSHPVSVVQTLPTGKQRSSNMVIGNLVPTLTAASVVTPIPAGLFAAIDLTGVLLGNAADDAVLALYQGGRVVEMFDVLTSPTSDQTARRLEIPEDTVPPIETPPPGEYLVILRVNSQQAPRSPRVILP